jgi:hypothetical protein
VVDALRASHENLIAKSATENFHEIDNVEIFGGIMLRLSDEYGTKTGKEEGKEEEGEEKGNENRRWYLNCAREKIGM